VYVSVCALISLVTYVLMPDTRNATLSRAEEAEAAATADADQSRRTEPVSA
jgi:MFS transporter, MHS family, alpha-ketoglutarate permease